MLSQLFLIVFLLLQLTMINSVYVYIEPNEKFCIRKYRNLTQVLHIVYSIAGGKEEDQNVITVYDPDDFNMLQERNSISNKVYLFIEREGYHKFCVENLESHKLTLSFYFGDEYSEGKISKKNAENFVDGVAKLTQKIETLKFNIENSALRKKSNYKIAQNIRKKINICTIIKIIFLLVFATLQLILITSIFNKVKIVKKVEIANEENKPLKSQKNKDIL